LLLDEAGKGLFLDEAGKVKLPVFAVDADDDTNAVPAPPNGEDGEEESMPPKLKASAFSSDEETPFLGDRGFDLLALESSLSLIVANGLGPNSDRGGKAEQLSLKRDLAADAQSLFLPGSVGGFGADSDIGGNATHDFSVSNFASVLVGELVLVLCSGLHAWYFFDNDENMSDSFPCRSHREVKTIRKFRLVQQH
jgi:hypothetical protein